jgi:hypothetical protein
MDPIEVDGVTCFRILAPDGSRPRAQGAGPPVPSTSSWDDVPRRPSPPVPAIRPTHPARPGPKQPAAPGRPAESAQPSQLPPADLRSRPEAASCQPRTQTVGPRQPAAPTRTETVGPRQLAAPTRTQPVGPRQPAASRRLPRFDLGQPAASPDLEPVRPEQHPACRSFFRNRGSTRPM